MSDHKTNKPLTAQGSARSARHGLRLVHDADAKPKAPEPTAPQQASPKSRFASMLTQIADQIDRDIEFIHKL